MKPTDITVEVRNVGLGIVGELDSEDMHFTLHKMYANIGTWTLSLPREHPLTDSLDTPGSGVVVSLNGEVIASGPTVTFGVTQSYSDPFGTVEFKGVTDTVLVQDGLAYPDPGNLPSEQTTVHDKRTASCETLMHGYVRDNIGPDALPARQHPHLQMGTNGARGKTVTRKPRFKNLGSVVAGLAKAGRLGFEVIQVADHLEFRTYAVQDKTATVVLDVEDDSIATSVFTRKPMVPTDVIVGGRGHGKKRKFRNVSTADSNAASEAYGRRIEAYMDYRGSDETPEASDLEAAGTDWLDDEMDHPVQLKITPSEYADKAYGTVWRLGDKITVRAKGVARTVVATGLIVKVDENGARYGVTLGDSIMQGGSNAGLGTRSTHAPGSAGGSLEDRISDLELESPDLGEYTLDGVDYVVEHRVLLIENGGTVPSDTQVGTIIFEKV